MRALSEFVVRVANLAEAEGRLARQKVLEVVSASMFWLGATVLLAAGVLLAVGALYLGLKTLMPAHWAMAIVALLPLALGAACVYLGNAKLKGPGRK